MPIPGFRTSAEHISAEARGDYLTRRDLPQAKGPAGPTDLNPTASTEDADTDLDLPRLPDAFVDFDPVREACDATGAGLAANWRRGTADDNPASMSVFAARLRTA